MGKSKKVSNSVEGRSMFMFMCTPVCVENAPTVLLLAMFLIFGLSLAFHVTVLQWAIPTTRAGGKRDNWSDRHPSTAALPTAVWSWSLLPPRKLTHGLCGGTNGFPWVIWFEGYSAFDLRNSFDDSLLSFGCCHLRSHKEVGKGCYFLQFSLTNFGCFFSFLCNVLTWACAYRSLIVDVAPRADAPLILSAYCFIVPRRNCS